MILYLDTSALIKRYVIETGSKEVNALIEQAVLILGIICNFRKQSPYRFQFYLCLIAINFESLLITAGFAHNLCDQ